MPQYDTRRRALGLILAAPLAACGLIEGGDVAGEDIAVADGNAATFELLTPRRRLPASARNVLVHQKAFLGATQWVRFEAPTVEARAWATRIIGRPLVLGENPRLRASNEFNWWLITYPAGAEGGQRSDPSAELPDIGIVLVPHGNMAVVWVRSFTV